MLDSHSAFIGEIPRNYEKYLGPLMFQVYAEDLASRISVSDGGLVLETAAGTGMATRQIRDFLSSSVKLIATDLNGDMLQVAKQKFSDDENIEFQTANALELPFADNSFDAIACQFSVMFFPDKLAALKEAARVLKPAGKFYFNVWDSFEHNQLAQIANQCVTQYFPDNPPDFFQTPYGYYQIDVIKQLLQDAGFADIDISILPRVGTCDSAKDVAAGFITGTPVRLQIEERDSNALPQLVAKVEQGVTHKFGSESIQAKIQAIVFSAQFKG